MLSGGKAYKPLVQGYFHEGMAALEQLGSLTE
jgi:hypothetical protein